MEVWGLNVKDTIAVLVFFFTEGFFLCLCLAFGYNWKYTILQTLQKRRMHVYSLLRKKMIEKVRNLTLLSGFCAVSFLSNIAQQKACVLNLLSKTDRSYLN